MLSLFPQLFDWSWYVPLAFRVFLAWYFISVGYGFARKGDGATEKDRIVWGLLGALVVLLGGALGFGIATQFVGAAGSVLAAFAMVLKRFSRIYGAVASESYIYYALLALVSFSLIFLGAGPYAVDIPL